MVVKEAGGVSRSGPVPRREGEEAGSGASPPADP
jgi:hypothetical protein